MSENLVLFPSLNPFDSISKLGFTVLASGFIQVPVTVFPCPRAVFSFIVNCLATVVFSLIVHFLATQATHVFFE